MNPDLELISKLQEENAVLRADKELFEKRWCDTVEERDLLAADLERARTYTGLEAEGCPLCTYVEGVFKAQCSLHRQLDAAKLQNQELQGEVNRLIRNAKCAGCGHSQENHDPRGCLVWVDADAHRKCLCRTWTNFEQRKGFGAGECQHPNPTGFVGPCRACGDE